jgi:hypothetical protein
VYLRESWIFRRKILPRFSGLKSKRSKKPTEAGSKLRTEKNCPCRESNSVNSIVHPVACHWNYVRRLMPVAKPKIPVAINAVKFKFRRHNMNTLLMVPYLAYSSFLNIWRCVPPKRRALSELHSITSLKAVLFNFIFIQLEN